MTEPATPPDLLSPADLAAEMGVPRTTVYEWNYMGTGPRRIRIGRHVRYRRADIDAWLEAHAVTQVNP